MKAPTVAHDIQTAIGKARMVRLEPKAPHRAQTCGGPITGSDDSAAFTRRDVLDRVETETRDIAEAADDAPMITAAERVCGVFDHTQTVFVSERIDTIEIAGITGIVYGHDRFDAGSQSLPRMRQIDKPAVRVHVA